MAKTVQEIMASMPPDRRERVDARARELILQELLRGATVSSIGLDITIACDDHDTKDAILALLTGDR